MIIYSRKFINEVKKTSLIKEKLKTDIIDCKSSREKKIRLVEVDVFKNEH
jgi:hypothetical protein